MKPAKAVARASEGDRCTRCFKVALFNCVPEEIYVGNSPKARVPMVAVRADNSSTTLVSNPVDVNVRTYLYF